MNTQFLLRHAARKMVFTLCVLFPLFCCDMLVPSPLFFSLMTIGALSLARTLWRALECDRRKMKRAAARLSLADARAAAPRTALIGPSAASVHQSKVAA